MPYSEPYCRILDPELQALLDTGVCEEHTTLVITLGDGTVLRFATAELLIDGHTFLANLKPSDSLKMSLSNVIDSTVLRVQNVDKVFGQQLTGISNALDGSSGMLGIAFIDGEGTIYHDDKIPGEIIAGLVDETTDPPECPIKFVGDIYAGQLVGDTIASIFPWSTAPPTVATTDPNDIGPIGGGFGGGGDGGDDDGRITFHKLLIL
jgi:hypothetical protein